MFATAQPRASLECYRSSGKVAWTIAGAVILTGIAVFAGGFYAMVLGAFAVCAFLYAAFQALDSRVQLQLSQSGISGSRLGGSTIPWDGIRRITVVQETEGMRIRNFVRFSLISGEQKELEISGLDTSEEVILKWISDALELPQE